MVRDLEKEQEKIRNGNRYIQEEGGTGVFSRDMDRLFLEYEPLRKKIYHKYRVNYSDMPSRMELASYIDEQFIKLVKEYDINNPVDFPGYIKRKLYARVSQGFVKKSQKDRGREIIGEEASILEETTEDTVDFTEDLEMYDLLTFIFKHTTLTEQEEHILHLLLQEKTDRHIEQELKAKFKIEPHETQELIKSLKEYIKNRLHDYQKA